MKVKSDHPSKISNLSNSGKEEAWKNSSVGRASHRYRRGHGFESRWSPDFFQASSFQLLKLENLLRWSLFTFILCDFLCFNLMNYYVNLRQESNHSTYDLLITKDTDSPVWQTNQNSNQIHIADKKPAWNKTCDPVKFRCRWCKNFKPATNNIVALQPLIANVNNFWHSF